MSRAGVRVGAGTRFRYDGETVEVIEMAITATGNEVVLKDHHGRLMRLAVRELLLSSRVHVIPDSPGPSSGDDEDIASVVLAQLSHPHLGYEFLATRWRTIQHYGVEIDSRRYSGPVLKEYGDKTSPSRPCHW